MRVGRARLSRRDQRLEPQRDALLADGCERIFEEKLLEARTSLDEYHYREELARLRGVFGLAYLGRYDEAAKSAAEAARIHDKRVEGGFRGRPTVARG
jgi:hypothetical protein